MHWLSIFRLAVFGWTLLCALVLLGLGGHAVSAFGTLLLPSYAWSGLGVATGVLTLVAMVPMLVIDQIRRGAITSMIVVELSVLGFLGVLFLATGGSAAANASLWGNCDVWSPDLARTICHEASAAAAFGFLAWLPLWAYTGTLLVMLIIHAQRGNYIWRQSVKEVNWEGGNAPPSAPGLYDPDPKQGQNPYPAAYPPVSPQSTGYTQPQAPTPYHPQV